MLADIYGGDNYSYDPFHLNDVQPFVRPEGSSLVLLSLRNQSSIIAFDIEEEKIIWKIERATMNQHDVDILNTKNNNETVFLKNINKMLEEGKTKADFTLENICKLRPITGSLELLKKLILSFINVDIKIENATDTE